MTVKYYKCLTCLNKFGSIKDVNQHIAKTGCNETKKVTIKDYFSDVQIRELENASYKYRRTNQHKLV